MKHSRTVWIILSTHNIGGAELRFYGLWKYANANSNDQFVLKLVCSQQLFDHFLVRENASFKNDQTWASNFVPFDFSGNHAVYRAKVKNFVKANVQHNDILHFVDGNPLISTSAKQVFSITQSSLKNLNIKGKAIQLLGAAFSDKVDVLDPKIYYILKKALFLKRRKINITSNSYCDIEKFEAKAFQDKNDWFVFLGRFETVKQVEVLIRCLPTLYPVIKDKFTRDLKFIFLGYGSLETTLMKLIQEPDFKNIPILIQATQAPEIILKDSRYFFSLQLNNNYPSRSLIEAMSAGNIPICTDVGQTRWLAKPAFSYYVKEKFSSSDLEHVLQEISNSSEVALTKKSEEARTTVLQEHTIEKMYDYYKNIYNII